MLIINSRIRKRAIFCEILLLMKTGEAFPVRLNLRGVKSAEIAENELFRCNFEYQVHLACFMKKGLKMPCFSPFLPQNGQNQTIWSLKSRAKGTKKVLK